MSQCIVPDCNNSKIAKGLCRVHYYRKRRNGNENIVLKVHRRENKDTALYTTYNGMKQRCNDSGHKMYKYYGGKGIQVDSRWMGIDGFDNFCIDMGQKPSSGHSLDRIDTELGYSKENCRWATWHEQAANKSNSNKVVGISWSKSNSYWVAELQVDNKRYHAHDKNYDIAVMLRKNLESQYLNKQ